MSSDKLITVSKLKEVAIELDILTDEIICKAGKLQRIIDESELGQSDEILKVIQRVLKHASLKTANFSKFDRQVHELPKSESEVNAFIKGRIKLWLDTWIVAPLEQLIIEQE
jgi:hypothetical protein